MTAPDVAERRAAEMRADFDASFRRRPQPRLSESHSALAVRIDGDECLIRLQDVARLVARPALTAVPAQSGSLLGLSWVQGEVVAVHDLGRLLGRTPMPPRWLAVTAADRSIGLAFAQFEGYRQLPVADAPDLTYLDVHALTRNAMKQETDR